MSTQSKKNLSDVVHQCGRYPESAFLFLRDGLSYSADRTHGAMTPGEQRIHRYVAKHELDLHELAELYQQQTLPEPVADAIREAGGCEKLNRHVSGHDLCWGLRDYARQRWGPLAQLVLNRWNIDTTLDFGRIVFALVDNDMLQKELDDTLEDFRDVYDFNEALTDGVEVGDGECETNEID